MNKALGYLVVLYLVSALTSIAGMEFFSSLIVLFCIVSFFQKNNNKRISFLGEIDIPLLGFLLWVVFQVFFISEINPDHRLHIVGSLRWIPILYFVYYAFSEHYEGIRKAWPYLGALMGGIAFWGLVQFLFDFTIKDFEIVSVTDRYYRNRGVFSSIMSYSYVFGMAFFFIFGRLVTLPTYRNREALYVALLTFLVGSSLFCTFTRGLWIGLLVGMVFVLFFTRRKLVFSFLTLVVVGGGGVVYLSSDFQYRVYSFFDLSNVSNSDRIALWRANWEIFKKNPIIGVGFRQNSSHVFGEYKALGIETDFISHAHNNFLSVLAGTGIIGFLLFMWLMSKLTWITLKEIIAQNREKRENYNREDLSVLVGAFGAMVCFLVGGLTESSFYDGETMHMFIVVVALMFVVKNRFKNNGSAS